VFFKYKKKKDENEANNNTDNKNAFLLDKKDE